MRGFSELPGEAELGASLLGRVGSSALVNTRLQTEYCIFDSLLYPLAGNRASLEPLRFNDFNQPEQECEVFTV